MDEIKEVGVGNSLGSVLQTKGDEIAQKNEELKRGVENDKLESAMNEVDEKREKIGDLQKQQDYLSEKQINLNRSLEAIKENVKIYKQKQDVLEDLYEKGKTNENLAIYFKENRINGWRDFLNHDELAGTDEAVEVKDSKAKMMESVGDRKDMEDNIREEQGFEGNVKGKTLEKKIEGKKRIIGDEVSGLKKEIPKEKAQEGGKVEEKIEEPIFEPERKAGIEPKLNMEKNSMVSEKIYKTTVLDDLKNNRPVEGETMVVVLAQKLGDLKDTDLNKSPVFVFGGKEYEMAVPIITKWLESIESVHYFLPELRVNYYMTKINEDLLDKIMEDPINSIPPEKDVLLSALVKYKEEMEKGQIKQAESEPRQDIEVVLKKPGLRKFRDGWKRIFNPKN